MNYEIKNEKVVFNEHYQMIKAQVTHDTFSGDKISVNRLAFHRGNSVAILLFEKDTNSIVLTKQFRFPTAKNGDGWMWEIPAGSMEENECPLTCVTRETLEETGYSIEKPQQIFNFYTSPGSSTEKQYLFYAEVFKKDKTESGGGLAEENEDILIEKIPISEIEKWLSEKIIDAKTIIALQWFLARKTKA